MKLTLTYDKLNAHRSRCNTFEPPHDKTNKMACALSEDSDQTRWGSLCCAHEESLGPKLPIKRTAKTLIRLGSLVRVFAVRMKKAWVLSYP